jgi:hypothetical protein
MKVLRQAIDWPTAVFARRDGRVLDFPGAQAAVDDGWLAPAQRRDFIPMPEGTLLLTLPGRSPIGYDGASRATIAEVDGEPADAVAAALPLGYTRTLLPAFASRAGAPALPLYGYAAVAWDGDGFVVGAVKTDELETWSRSAHAEASVRRGIGERLKEFPRNRLIRQLAVCATEYGCFTAQNAFLRAGEAALPVSPACNAKCIGCIS